MRVHMTMSLERTDRTINYILKDSFYNIGDWHCIFPIMANLDVILLNFYMNQWLGRACAILYNIAVIMYLSRCCIGSQSDGVAMLYS